MQDLKREVEELKRELGFYKKCFGELCFFERHFNVPFEEKTVACKNIIGPVSEYQQNAKKLVYEENGNIKRKELRRESNKRKRQTDIFLDKRKRGWKKSQRLFNYNDPLNFKQHGIIENAYCKHINSKGHNCKFCKVAWQVAKSKKGCDVVDVSKYRQYI